MADGWGGGGLGGSSLPGQELLTHTMTELEQRHPPKTFGHSFVEDVPERRRRTKLRWFLWTAVIVAAIVVASILFR
jgi:hypothetical protein